MCYEDVQQEPTWFIKVEKKKGWTYKIFKICKSPDQKSEINDVYFFKIIFTNDLHFF